MNNDYSKPESKANPMTHPETLVKDIEREVLLLADWTAKKPAEAPKSFFYISSLPDMSKAPRYINGGKKNE